MCLITDIHKLVAKNDIPCYKILNRDGYNKYSTPYRKTPVKLGEELVADDGNWDYNEEGYNSIGGGYIHALLSFSEEVSSFDYNRRIFMAIIPAGTEFYVSNDFSQICARRMFITNYVVRESNGVPLIAEVGVSLSEFYPQNIEEGKVAIGDFCVVDEEGNKSYIHRSEYTSEIDDNIIGVVGFFNVEGKPVVVSRDEVEKEWCTLLENKQHLINDRVVPLGYVGYKRSLNGKELTENILKSKEYKPAEYPVFKWIASYKTKGTKKGDWYVGAIGELGTMLDNTMQINISLMLLKDTTLLYRCLWSSSENSDIGAWFSYPPDSGSYGSDYDRKSWSRGVRALAVFDV